MPTLDITLPSLHEGQRAVIADMHRFKVQAAGCELAQEETVVSMETAVLSFRGVFAREHMGAAYVA